MTHDRRHMTRAVLEGVAFGLRDGLDLMDGSGDACADPDPRIRRRVGQPALAPVPPHVLDAEIATVDSAEGAAYGAGLLAAVGARWFASVAEAAAATVHVTPVADARTGRRAVCRGARAVPGPVSRPRTDVPADVGPRELGLSRGAR